MIIVLVVVTYILDVATGNDVSRFNANSFNPRNLVPFASGSYLKRY